MRAVLHTAYGPAREVLALGEADVPEPGDGELLVRVRAVSIAAGDVFMVGGVPLLGRLMWGLSRPKAPIPGLAIAGVVERAAGAFQVGDRVFGELTGGGLAEYAVAPEATFAAIPDALTFEQAAAIVVSGPTALQGIEEAAAVREGQHVLINGASGGVGTYAVQIAKALGAEVTAVCSTRNADQARELGADHVVDYTREDFVAGGPRYDVVFDLAGSRSLGECRSVLKPTGAYVASTGSGSRTFGPMARLLGMMLLNPFTRQRLVVLSQRVDRDGLERVAQMVLDGKVEPVIEEVYPFDRAVDALADLEQGHARGKRVIALDA